MKQNIAKPEETKSSCYCNNKAKKTKLMFQERQKVSPQEKGAEKGSKSKLGIMGQGDWKTPHMCGNNACEAAHPPGIPWPCFEEKHFTWLVL